jgi:hypothetical protein
MADEIDWKAKCRKVAEWMGEIWNVTDHPNKYAIGCQSAHFSNSRPDQGGTLWPDYTRDDAAAWRLCKALDSCHFSRTPTHEYDDESRYRVTVCLDKGNPVFIAYAGTKATGLVLAACQLIDEGVKPMEST